MKNFRIVLVGFAIAALAVACSQKEETPAEEPEEAAKAAEGTGDEDAAENDEADEAEAAAEASELEERGVAFMEEVAAAGTENAEDCDAVASSWSSLIEDNEDLLAEMRDRAATQTPEEQAAFEERYADRLGAFMEQMTEVIQACQENEEVLALVEQLNTSE